jgi:guanyl-specific ribonuclease Sa
VNVTLAEPQALTFGSTGKINVRCNGEADGSVTLNGLGGTAPFAYSIDGTNFQDSNVFAGLQAGTYTFTLKDANSCTTTMNIMVDQPNALSVAATATDPLCHGEASGMISAAASGGIMPYTYSIDGSTFQNSNEFTGLVAGSYTVTLKDANECTFMASVTVDEPTALSVTAMLVDDNTINATGMGGTGPYEYSIDGTVFQSSGTFSNLSNGDYTITVRDANDCTATANSSLIVTSLDLPDQLPTINTYPNPVSDVLIISEVATGDRITLIDLNGQLINEVKIKVTQKDYALSVSHVKEGVFLLRIKNRKGRTKLVKKVIRRH